MHVGSLAVFAPRTTWPSRVDITQADLTLTGSANFEWFAWSAEVVDASAASSTMRIVVGSPGFRTSNGTVGRVAMYDIPSVSAMIAKAAAVTEGELLGVGDCDTSEVRSAGAESTRKRGKNFVRECICVCVCACVCVCVCVFCIRI